VSTNDTFEIFKDVAGQFRWRLNVGNREIVATSEAYTTTKEAVASAHKMPEWTSNTPVKDLTH